MVAFLAVGTFAATFGFWLGRRWQRRRDRLARVEREAMRAAATRGARAGAHVNGAAR